MDTAQWPQGLLVKPLEEIIVPIPTTTALCAPKPSGNITASNSNGGAERKPRPQKEQALNCPRCNSSNTKFCYYNNYSLTQPRYFCKTCRRYWTEGGSLRNIPVGGGSRKNKGRPSSSASSASTSAASSSAPPPLNHTLLDAHHHHHHLISGSKLGVSSSSPSTVAMACNSQNPNKGGQDLNLELLNSKGLLSSFMSMPLSVPHDPSGVYAYPSTHPRPHGFFPGFHEMKPAGGLGFSLDGVGGGFRNALHENPANINSGSGNLLFPFEQVKQSNDSMGSQNTGSAEDDHQHHQQQHRSDHQHHANGFWSGLMGGGSW
ncbi:hypothetical protein SAY87_031985 [Trapa incisa]|uniref:Dof zinc finger protein n=1 Tax=Trapa incisa TaxID=236973 RepID=A0AAN7QNV3_9MYRT|nr:hypothetical protein SAY87_031985 [Trapa incisa]